MYNHNKAQQSKNRVHISWDILYILNWTGFRWISLNWEKGEGNYIHYEQKPKKQSDYLSYASFQIIPVSKWDQNYLPQATMFEQTESGSFFLAYGRLPM